MSEASTPKPSDNLLFDVKPLDRALIDIIPRMASPTRWPAFNAVRHLNRAWKIRNGDPEMALFRSITAEEEAASALILALKRRHYPDAANLRHNDHLDKNAVIPFFDALSRVIEKIRPVEAFEVLLDLKHDPPRLALRFTLREPLTGTDINVYPKPPLHFKLTRGPTGKERFEDFRDGLKEVASKTESASIVEHLRQRAQHRNRLLYASDKGYPEYRGNIDAAMRAYQRNTLTLLRIYHLVDPYPQRQNFVAQAVRSFSKVVSSARRRKEITFD